MALLFYFVSKFSLNYIDDNPTVVKINTSEINQEVEEAVFQWIPSFFGKNEE